MSGEKGEQEGRWGGCPPRYSLKLSRWDSPRTQICILGCWIATGRRASHTETPACPQTAEYSHQSQSSVRWGPRDLDGHTGTDEGRRWASHSCTNPLRMVSVQPWSGSLWAAYRLAVPKGLMVTCDQRHKKIRSQCVLSTGSFPSVGLKSRNCESQCPPFLPLD